MRNLKNTCQHVPKGETTIRCDHYFDEEGRNRRVRCGGLDNSQTRVLTILPEGQAGNHPRGVAAKPMLFKAQLASAFRRGSTCSLILQECEVGFKA